LFLGKIRAEPDEANVKGWIVVYIKDD